MKRAFLRPALYCIFGASLALGLASCGKDRIEPESTLSAEDSADAEGTDAATTEYVDAYAPADVNGAGSCVPAGDLQLIGGTCASRSYDAATRTLTITFDPNGCVGRDGRVRRGQIVAVFTGQRRQPGSSVVITLVGYSINGNPHTGTRTLTYTSPGVYELNVQNASISTSQGTATWTSQRTYTQTAGQGTCSILDDEYSVTGSASGTNRRGIGFRAVIQQPLKKTFQRGCARFFTAGTVEITTDNEKTLLLNYDPSGTAPCDNIATVTRNGRTRTIRLR